MVCFVHLHCWRGKHEKQFTANIIQYIPRSDLHDSILAITSRISSHVFFLQFYHHPTLIRLIIPSDSYSLQEPRSPYMWTTRKLSHQSISLKYDGSQGRIAVFALEPQRRDYLEKPRNLELKAYVDASSRGRPQSRVLSTSENYR